MGMVASVIQAITILEQVAGDIERDRESSDGEVRHLELEDADDLRAVAEFIKSGGQGL